MIALRCFRISALGAKVLLRPGPSAGAPEQYGEPWSRLLLAFCVTYLYHVGCRQPNSGRALGQAALAGSTWPSARSRVLLQEQTPLCLASVWFSQQ